MRFQSGTGWSRRLPYICASNPSTMRLSYLLLLSCLMGQAQEIPTAIKKPLETGRFGLPFTDNYRWLEDVNSPETRAWVDAENAVTDAHFTEVRKTVSSKAAIQDYAKRATYYAPYQKGRYFYTYYRKSANRPASLYVIRNLQSEPEELVNPYSVTGDADTPIRAFFPSKNDKYLAYLMNAGGSDRGILRLKNLGGGKDPDDIVNNVRFSGVAWHGDNAFLYKRNDNRIGIDKDSTFRLMYHRIGSDEAADETVFDASTVSGDISYFKVSGNVLSLLVKNRDETIQGLYFANLSESPFRPTKFGMALEGYEFKTYRNGLIYCSSRKYPWGDLRTISVADKSERILIPQIYMNLLVDVDFFKDYILCKYKADGQFYMGVYDSAGKFIRKFILPYGLDYQIGSFDYDKEEVYVTFSSYVIPAQNYRLNLQTGASDIFFSRYNKAKPTLFPFDYFETKNITYKSRDGEDVPITIVHKRGLKLDGNNPTLLEAYGGFGHIHEPTYSNGIVYFLENGGVYAFAEIRGNGDKGTEWHEKGRGVNKINTFNDFIDAAEYLIREQYTSSSKLAITGGSQGGLLVGTAVTMRPDLFRVAIPRVGVYDMPLFYDYSVGSHHIDEYGDISTEKGYRDVMAYSPYHRIKEDVDYPIMLIITGENDERVPPFQSYKFAARMQDRPSQKNPVFLRVNRNAGHYGKVANAADFTEQTASMFDFILYHLK